MSFQLGNEGILFSLQTTLRQKTDEILSIDQTLTNFENNPPSLNQRSEQARIDDINRLNLIKQNTQNQISNIQTEIDQILLNIELFRPEVNPTATQNIPIETAVEPITIKLDEIFESIKTSVEPSVTDSEGETNLLLPLLGIGALLFIL